MSKLAYFDCFAGAGGDMIVGALLDAGADFAALKEQLGSLQVPHVTLAAEKVNRGGIVGTKFHVNIEGHDHGHRGLGDVLKIIDAGRLAPRCADRARKIFTRLAQAEAKVHNIDVERVHFHEVGAIDSIMDIVGSCVGLELLDIDAVACSPIPLGSGTITCAHGLLPVPAPATAQLLQGAQTVPGVGSGELTTPTAAAVLTTLTQGYGPVPEMDVQSIGYGAGTRNEGPLPNLLRVYVGQPSELGDVDTVVELSANIDDCSGQLLGATIEKLLSAGCLDAWASPIVMKKSRPAWTLSALCAQRDVAAVERLLFAETPTFGIRRHVCSRRKLGRRFESVETPYGPVRMKIGSLAGQDVTVSPEFADCAAAAEAHHVSIREVLQAAIEIHRRGGRHGG